MIHSSWDGIGYAVGTGVATALQARDRSQETLRPAQLQGLLPTLKRYNTLKQAAAFSL